MNIELLNIDCMEYMNGVPDMAFDLAIVDPPYGIGINHNMGRRKGDKASSYKPAVWDNEAPKEEYFNSLFRISKNQIIWGANHFIENFSINSSCWLMWDKGFSEDLTFSQYELAWTSFKTTCKKYDKHPNLTDRIHPTQKPTQLYKWILKNYAEPGQKIFDSHGGSMSIAIACHQMGYDLTLCEIDKDYYDAGVKRFREQTTQQSLFK